MNTPESINSPLPLNELVELAKGEFAKFPKNALLGMGHAAGAVARAAGVSEDEASRRFKAAWDAKDASGWPGFVRVIIGAPEAAEIAELARQ